MPQAGLQQRGGQSSIAAPSLLLPGDARDVGFTPASLPGLVLWLDAGSIAQANNTSVSTWTDQSGQGNHAVQGTVSQQPTYLAAGLVGHPALRFDGVDDVLMAPNLLLGAGARTVYLACQLGATYTAGNKLLGLNDDPLLGNGAEWGLSDAPALLAFGGNRVWGTTVGSAAAHVLAVGHGANTTTATALCWLDGAALAPTSTIVFAVATGTGGPTAVARSLRGGTAYQAAIYGAILVYAQQHTAQQVAFVTRYLGARYGVVVA